MASVSYNQVIGDLMVRMTTEAYDTEPFYISISNTGNYDEIVNTRVKNPDQLRRLAKCLERCADFYEENKDD